jgi:hypothetical protein
MNLLVGFYNDASPVRTGEFVECVRRNAANPHIDSIIVFIEDQTPPADVRERSRAWAHPKVQFVEHALRLSFKQLFEYANRHLAGDGVIIANADIYFDETLALLEEESLAGRLLCLSRWDETPDGALRHFDRPDSQDAWIFEPPLPRFASDFFLGKPGCENRLAYEAERAGLAVSNPSRSLRARHLHNSAIRRYTQRDRVNGPLRFVPASFLDNGVPPPKPPRPSPKEFPSHRGRRTERMVNERFQEIEAVLIPYLGGKMPRRLRREMLHAVGAQIEGPPRPADEPLATVAFRETMGYTLARLELGVSTHNNDPRPLVFVPPELAGLPFTQAVSCHSTPVEIEFRTPGRLFVLAAPGWEGYEPAVAFLDDAGWREPIEPLRTGNGTVFEPWSLAADAGERLVVPTQVMLAAKELVRME